MKFDDWWKMLSPKEQTVIGKNNARYIWREACEACAKLCDDAEKRYEELWEKFGYPDDEGRMAGACFCAADIRAKAQE